MTSEGDIEMGLELKDRCAVVTGAASGIGLALAHEAVRRHMDVALFDVDADVLEEAAASLRSNRVRVLSRSGDVSSLDAVEAFADAVFEEFKSVAVVFANAGLLRTDDTARPSMAVWNLMIDVNLRGPVNTVAAFVGRMLDRGEPAQFVITGSQGSFLVAPSIGAYVATKHAVWALAETLHMELTAQKSCVGASLLAPGRVRSRLTAALRAGVLAEQGEDAAKAYDQLMMEPDTVAHRTFDRVVERAFWILPSDDYKSMLRDRLRPLLDKDELKSC
jgi:NAD(P)-dependent dehydrogenase (short-subunit alcohol dehydrogenase family)